MPKKKVTETPAESFERLRQAFDSIKENHTDPWCWHPYINDDADHKEKEEDIAVDDPEAKLFQPKSRSLCEKLKSHLISTSQELHRAAEAADMAYFHMSTSPEHMKECCIILGTSGDIDEDMLASGDASPQKILAALQEKLRLAKEKIADLEQDILNLKEKLVDTLALRDIYFKKWQLTSMYCEEAIGRLHGLSENFNEEMRIKDERQKAFDSLSNRFRRCDRLMKYQGREVMRVTFKANKKENMFYAFVGFVAVLQAQKAEREARELEARRDAVEFSLKNEVRFLVAEIDRRQIAVETFSKEDARMKTDRRLLAKRILNKMRPYEPLEYCLWIWEWWRTVSDSGALRFEKKYEQEEMSCNAMRWQLLQTTAQIPLMATRMDVLKRQMAEEKTQADLNKRKVTNDCAEIITNMWEKMAGHRIQERETIARLQYLEIVSKDERIAVLERDIAEDQHIRSLKSMVVDLEGRLRKALDRRKARGLVVPPMKGVKCVMCSREVLHRNWKSMPDASETTPRMSQSRSEADLSEGAKAWRLGLSSKFGDKYGDVLKAGSESPSFAPVWRPC